MANRAAEQLLGYARDSLTDRPVFDLYADTPSGKEKAQRLNQRIRAGEEICDEELEMRKFDGSSVWINLTVQLIRDERGRLLERRAIVVDVTERKRADEALRESERRVRELASASVRAHEEERQWAALEVHDRIAQSLVSVFHQLQGLQFMTRTDPRVHPVVQRSSTLLQEAIRESQNIMNDLYPAGLDEFGVVPLMEAELSRFQEDTGCRVSFNADSGVMPSQSQEVGVTLYRIFHEALTNIQRHAPGAQNVVVSLTYREMFVSLEIQDDGPGFDMEAVTEDNRIGGLMSMQRRAEIIGGSFEVTSKPGEGTVVTISVPIESA